MKTLKSDTVKALSWNVSGNIIGKILAFVISIILARILSPEEFGLIAIVMIFSSFIQVFSDFGFASAIIQRENVTQTDLSSLFFLNLIIGAFLSVLSFILSDVIAVFFETPLLSDLIKIVSVTFFLSSISIVPTVILRKTLKFKFIVLANVFSSIIAGSIAIIMALKGFGVYSLLAQTIINVSIITPFIFIASKWKPNLTFKIKSVQKYFAFGSHMFLINIISKFLEEINSILIGKFFPIANLGVFRRALTLRRFPINIITGGIYSVMFSSLSIIQKDNSRLIKYYSSILHILAFTLLPTSAILVVVAKPLILVLLTDKWIDVIPLFQILVSVIFFVSLGGLSTNIITAKGETKFLLKYVTIKRIIITLTTLLFLYWGILSLVIGITISTFLYSFFDLYYGGKAISFKIKAQLKIILPYFVLSSISSLFAYALFSILSNIYLQLILPAFLGLSLYLLFSYLFKIKGFSLLKEEIMKPVLLKLKKN